MSLPSWERGLKYLKKLPVVGSDHVAPLVGAWIEIETAAGGGTGNMSLPSWERGLKLDVATGNSKTAEVAPLVGAWIEITVLRSCRSILPSLPSWERGLKYTILWIIVRYCGRSPRGSVD